MTHNADNITKLLNNSTVNSSIKLIAINRYKKETVFELECPQKSRFSLKSTEFMRKIGKGEQLCKCCDLIRKQEEAKENFKQYGYRPIEIEAFKNESSRIKCYDSEGYIVHVSLKRLKDPNFKAKKGRFDKKYLEDSTTNLKLLFSKVGLKLLETEKYTSGDANYTALKDNKYYVSVKIGNVNKILESTNQNLEFIFDPFRETNPYRHENAKIYLTERGIKPISTDSGEILRYENNRIFVMAEIEEEFLGEIHSFKYKLNFTDYRGNNNLPSKSHSSNPYFIENMQKLTDIKGWDCEIIEIDHYSEKNVYFKVKFIRGKDDYFAITNRDSIMATNKNSRPLLFSQRNPFTIDNIKTFCKSHREDYELLSTEYITAHKYLKFKYIGNNPIKGDVSEFEMSWSNFANMKNPSIFVTSRAESMLLEVLKSKGLNVGTQNRFEGCKFKNYLKFDAVIFKKDFNQEKFLEKNFVKEDYFNQILLVIEYQGVFHYEDIYGQLDEQEERDSIKKKFCIEHSIPFEELVQVSHEEIEESVDHIFSKYTTLI